MTEGERLRFSKFSIEHNMLRATNHLRRTDTATTDRSAGAIVIVGCAIGSAVLRAVLVLLGRAVGWVVVLRTGSSVQRAALRVHSGVSTLSEDVQKLHCKSFDHIPPKRTY